MLGSLQDRQPLGFGERFVKRGAKTSRHDAVPLCDGHQNGAAEGRQVGDAVVAVAQQPLHRQPRIVVRADILEPIPWRNEQQPRRLVALAHAGRSGHSGPQGFADQEQRCAIEAMGERDGLFRVADHVLFAQRSVAWTVARVLGEDHSQTEWRERLGIERTVTGMSGVAMKDDDGAAHGAARLRDEAPEVLRRRPRAEPSGDQVSQGGLVGEVEQTVLEHGDSCKHDQARDGEPQNYSGEAHRPRERLLLHCLAPVPAGRRATSRVRCSATRSAFPGHVPRCLRLTTPGPIVARRASQFKHRKAEKHRSPGLREKAGR